MNIRYFNTIQAFAALAIIGVVFLCSCKSNTSSEVNGESDSLLSDLAAFDSLMMSDTTTFDTTATVNYLFPSPDEILGEILSTMSDFDLKYINPTSNANKYLGTKQQALNMGVYMTDLAYINLTDEKNTALQYFKTVRDLSQKINIYKSFDEKIYDRIQNNLAEKDSLNEILKSMYNNIMEMLESSNRNNIHALIASGALIEALYISTMNVKTFEEYKPIATKIFEQKYLISNFYEFAWHYKNDPNVREVLILLNKFKTILESSSSETSEKTVRKTNDNLVIGGGEDIIVTEKKFNEFKQSVTQIRAHITSGK
jgi:hypothetical protein